MRSKNITSSWFGKIENAPRMPDLDYWLGQSDSAKLEAAWDLIVEAYKLKGIKVSESGLQRAIGGLQRREG